MFQYLFPVCRRKNAQKGGFFALLFASFDLIENFLRAGLDADAHGVRYKRVV